MRLISQVANEIWICDNKTVTRYNGNIENFKMDMRAQMGIDEKPGQLKGDASVAKKDNGNEVKPKPVKDDDSATAATSTTTSSFDTEPMRRTLPSSSAADSAPPQRKAYVPPHLRNK